MEGACLCGAVTVSVNDSNLFGEQRRGHICHCPNCKKVAGGVFGANLIIESEKVTYTGEDNLTRYEDPETLSGTPVQRYFCKTCGTPIRSVTPLYKGMVVLKLGVFTSKNNKEMQKIPQPEWESFASQRQDWEKSFEGCIQYKTKTKGELLE